MSSSSSNVVIDRLLPDNWAEGQMRSDMLQALTSTPKRLSPKWLYDDRGSELFDQITRLPEYYLTEAERSLLVKQSPHIVAEAAKHGISTVVELGSGTSDKTTTLLDAFWEADQVKTFVPLDVSEQTLLDAANSLSERYQGLEVHAVVGDFTQHLAKLPAGPGRMIVFLGSTIGNFFVEERRALLGAMADTLQPGELILLGADLYKQVERIIHAYSDSAGLTEAFTKNVLDVLNREFDADFSKDAFDFVPFWDPQENRIDVRLRAQMPHSVSVRDLNLEVDFGEGEELQIEVSTKFKPEQLAAELDSTGFELVTTWLADGPAEASYTPPQPDFGLFLARRR